MDSDLKEKETPMSTADPSAKSNPFTPVGVIHPSTIPPTQSHLHRDWIGGILQFAALTCGPAFMCFAALLGFQSLPSANGQMLQIVDLNWVFSSGLTFTGGALSVVLSNLAKGIKE